MAVRAGGCIKGCVGLFLLPIVLGGVIWFLPNLNRVLNHEQVQAVVVDLIPGVDSDGDTVYTPVYEYEVNGKPYRYQSLVSLGGLLVPDLGDTKTLLYNPDNPSDARVYNVFLLLVLPGALVAIPLLILFAIIVASLRRRERVPQTLDWAPSQPLPQWSPPTEPAIGNPDTITATFMGVEASPMDQDGRVRYKVRARAELDGEIHRFESDWMDEDPTLDLMQQGNQVEVRIEPGNPANYEVVVPR